MSDATCFPKVTQSLKEDPIAICHHLPFAFLVDRWPGVPPRARTFGLQKKVQASPARKNGHTPQQSKQEMSRIT